MRDLVRAEAGLWPELESLTQFEEQSTTSETAWAESPFSESEEAELAATLLEAGGARQLDRFLGGLIQRATRSLGGVGNSRLGRVLGGMLKSLAKGALPGRGPDPAVMSAFAPGTARAAPPPSASSRRPGGLCASPAPRPDEPCAGPRRRLRRGPRAPPSAQQRGGTRRACSAAEDRAE